MVFTPLGGLGGLHEVAARHEEIAEHFVVVGGTERLAEERFGLVEAMLAHGDERCVGVGLGKFGGFRQFSLAVSKSPLA